MDNFLQIINDLQDVFSTVGVSPDVISLPLIVVVGSQSIGKSSVLEGIVQKNFLPRGTGIVTRRPLVIQINQDNSAREPWGCFLHDPDTKYTDFEKISEEILKDTDRVCGSNKGILPEPITIKIYSADLPTLTLVDLPGITKNPVGDQPEDIEKQTTDLVRKYIENPNSIILAVSPGNIDIANSEAIKLAKEVDPQGKRTLAVITKVDLMDKTVENSRVLEGKIIPIKLGIVGVINRNQTQIDANISMAECLRKEAHYFKMNFNYMTSGMGTPYLTQRLCTILMHHVKECLPELITRITEQKVIQQNTLDALGPKVKDDMGMLADMIMRFCYEFKGNMDGTKSAKFPAGDKPVSGGRQLFLVFDKAICKELDKICLPDDIKTDIEHEILSAGGYKPALFTSNIVFDNLASKQLCRFIAPIKKSIKICNEAIVEIITILSKSIFERFPNLKKESHQIALRKLLEKCQLVEEFIDSYLKCEITYINTNHRIFIKERPRIEAECLEDLCASDASVQEELPAPTLSAEDRLSVRKIQKLLELYINIIRDQLMDVVPKTVVCYMVIQFCDDLHNDLLKELFSQTKICNLKLMKEDLLVEEKRQKALTMLTALERADAITSLIE